MSYDLVFWHSTPPRDPDPATACAALRGGHAPPNVDEIPVDQILAALVAAFPGAAREPNGDGEWICWEATESKDSLQVEWSRYHVLATCRGRDIDVPNTVIDVLSEFGLPLFDPQTGERFEAPSG